MTHLLDSTKELTVGQLAARSGVAVSALHFYETKGLIHSRRTTGNQRRYTRDTLRRIAFIRVSQRVGIPLSTIREALAELPEERTPTRKDWTRLSAAWRNELDGRIEQLQRLRDDLTGCIGCGCLSLGQCRLTNPSDVLGDEGPGPRRLLVMADEPRMTPCAPTPEQIKKRSPTPEQMQESCLRPEPTPEGSSTPECEPSGMC